MRTLTHFFKYYYRPTDSPLLDVLFLRLTDTVYKCIYASTLSDINKFSVVIMRRIWFFKRIFSDRTMISRGNFEIPSEIPKRMSDLVVVHSGG